jgi:hypothetical protein
MNYAGSAIGPSPNSALSTALSTLGLDSDVPSILSNDLRAGRHERPFVSRNLICVRTNSLIFVLIFLCGDELAS